jgi:spermidine/putrescine transport system ATP-binding protein
VKGDGHELVGEGFTVIAARAADDAVPGNPGLAAVRPEAVTLELEVPDQAINAVHGRLAGISHLGDLIQYVVITTSGREMLSRQPRHEAPRLDPGADVWCRWETDRVQIFGGDQSTVVIADPAL